jgi:ABC-type amino acid transport substrate-binding protein
LFPVIPWLIRERPDLTVIAQEPTHERLGIAFAPARADLCEAVDAAIRDLRASGEFAKLQANWPGTEASL